jgi:hypothetical protein
VVQFSGYAALSGRKKMAAPCAGDTLHPAGHQAHVVGAALAALKSRPREAGPVALRDMDALRIKGWSKIRPCHEPAADAAERQRKLKINVKVWRTEDR